MSFSAKINLSILAICIAGCSGCDSGSTISDFEDRLRRDAGPDAEVCGIVAIEESRLNANICLADAFSIGAAAFAIFMEQGVDSQGADGTVTRGGAVTFYTFDSDPTGGGALDNGEILSSTCEQPQLSGSVDGRTLFNCSNPPSFSGLSIKQRLPSHS